MSKTVPARSAIALTVLLGFLAVGPGPAAIECAHAEPPPMPRAPDGYRTRQIEGWTILVNSQFLRDQPDLANRTLTLLGFQLYQITRVIPSDALQKLRTVRIWVEENEPHHPCMAYHPDPGWLTQHGMTPKKARCVEIANARHFLDWTLQQPWMVLHELAHAYHHQFLEDGFQNAEVKTAFDRAVEAGRYNKVLRYGGQEEKAYALNNPQEYFAEATEAYFGTNDFFPFIRIELRRHDPGAYAALESAWGIRPSARNRAAVRKASQRRPGSPRREP